MSVLLASACGPVVAAAAAARKQTCSSLAEPHAWPQGWAPARRGSSSGVRCQAKTKGDVGRLLRDGELAPLGAAMLPSRNCNPTQCTLPAFAGPAYPSPRLQRQHTSCAHLHLLPAWCSHDAARAGLQPHLPCGSKLLAGRAKHRQPGRAQPGARHWCASIACFQALVHLPGSNQAVLVLAQHEHWSKQQQPDWREHVHALPPRAKPSLALPI